MIFVLVDEIKGEINTRIEPWKETLKWKGFKLVGAKNEYLECNFSIDSRRNNEMRIKN